MSNSEAVTSSSQRYAPLHTHSEYSLSDGIIRIRDYVALAKERGYRAIALTDHGNMHTAIDFYLETKKAGIVGILGCEINHLAHPETEAALTQLKDHLNIPEHRCGPHHLVILAKNHRGYHKLLRLISSGYRGAQLREVPIIPTEEMHDPEGNLIVLTSCMHGELALLTQMWRQVSGVQNTLLHFEDPKVTPVAQAVKALLTTLEHNFGKGNVFVELIDNLLPGQSRLCADLAQIAEWFDVPTVASCDAHYLHPEERETHALATAIRNGLTLTDIQKRLTHSEFHLFDDSHMQERYAQWPAALENIPRITDMCEDLNIRMNEFFLPKIDLGTSETPTEALKRLSMEGLEARYPQLQAYYGSEKFAKKRPEYLTRLEYELEVIIQMGFPDYFLIVQDFINWAKQQGIPVGPGRGSGAGSLVAFALKITDLDPIPYNLIFERFLNPERVSMPDFDVDFCQWRRDEVIQYCIEKYGKENVAQITTFGKMQAKAAVKSVGRALGLRYTLVDQFTKLFPPDLGITLTQALDAEPKLQEEMQRNEQLGECMDFALKLEGLCSHTSVHAAGLVISDGAMENYVPTYTTDGSSQITQYEMKPTEKVGLVKFDFLGLKTLTVIEQAIQLIHLLPEHQDFSIHSIPLDDPRTYEYLSAGHSVGVFQCESAGMTQLIRNLRPSTFEDIIALVALFRPGPLGSGMVESFVKRKHGEEKITYLHPLLEPILKDTYGMFLYEEPVQKIAAVLANYSLGEADLLRRAMGKKIAAEMAQQKTRFLEGSKENNIDPTLAEEIFDLMAEFAKYGFNKSHSGAYGLVSYQTAYLKAHFPEQFLAASMSCDRDNTDKVIRYAGDCLRLNFTICPPNINRSEWLFDVPGPQTVGFALGAVKGLGESSLKPILQERGQHGMFKDLMDLVKRVNLNHVGKKSLQVLIEVGALDCFGYSRQDLLPHVAALVDYSQQLHEAHRSGQGMLFNSNTTEDTHLADMSDIVGPLRTTPRPWCYQDLQNEKRLLGIYLTAHPMSYFREDVRRYANGVDLATVLQEGRTLPPLILDQEGKRKGRGSNKKMTFVSYLAAVTYRRAKSSGKMMAYLTFEDGKTSYEAMMFSSQLENNELPTEPTAVLVHAAVNATEQAGQFRISVDKVMLLEEARQENLLAILVKIPAVTEESANAPHNTYTWVGELKHCLDNFSGKVRIGLQLEFAKTTARYASANLPKIEASDPSIIELLDTLPDQTSLTYYCNNPLG
ncbi:MAG: DNA polymerase III subunit alpha [Zetaproteobacteria bacterium]|nr:DNA polymerase III subunit alpha [Zetaproteobacteria bacterium]